MALEYSYQPETVLLSPGFPGEEVGIEPNNVTQPIVTSATSGEATYTYYYTDTNGGGSDPAYLNGNSTQVFINVTDKWTASVGDNNVLTISVTTVINSMRRGNKRGNPNIGGTYGRDIKVGRSASGPFPIVINGDSINTEHSLISAPVNLGTATYTLNPGENVAQSSFYIWNHTTGFGDDPKYRDELRAGIAFRNTMPDDYRPFAVWNGFNWASCNRAAGMDSIWTGSTWLELRTVKGGQAAGDPPFIYNGAQWVDQLKVGQGG